MPDYYQILGDTENATDSEIKARKAIELVADKVHMGGLTEKVEAWFEEND